MEGYVSPFVRWLNRQPKAVLIGIYCVRVLVILAMAYLVSRAVP